MNRNQKLRLKYFEKYSKNLEYVSTHEYAESLPQFSNQYLCPICMCTFPKESLDIKNANSLTLEDVPPKSLGGKPVLLTCHSCNSRCGHEIDNHLLSLIREIDFKSFLPNSSQKTSISILDKSTVNGIVKVNQEGKLIIDVRSEWSNPKDIDNQNKNLYKRITRYSPLFRPGKRDEFETNPLTIKFPNNANKRRAEIALLKTAYLYAFSVFGNGFLINPNLRPIQEQIRKPDELILKKPFWINYTFPDIAEGINLVKSPSHLRCFLIIFTLQSSSSRRQISVMLPGTSSPGFDIYNNFEESLKQKPDNEALNIELQHIPNSDYFQNNDKAWSSHYYWQEYCK